MTTDITKNPLVSGIIERAKNILMKPDAEWDKIEGETTPLQNLFTHYVLILAAIPAVFTLLKLLLTNTTVTVGTLTMGMTVGDKIAAAVASYVSSVLLVAVLALVAEHLAPQFGGKQDRAQAFKLTAYSLTASWAAGVLIIIHFFLATVAGLYSYYLFYLGAQKLLKVSKDKAIVFTAIVAVLSLIVTGVIFAIIR